MFNVTECSLIRRALAEYKKMESNPKLTSKSKGKVKIKWHDRNIKQEDTEHKNGINADLNPFMKDNI